MLKENNEIIADSTKCAEITNNFFSDAVVNLDIDRTLNTNNVEDIYDRISKSIIKYKNHPSIVKINEYIIIDSYFNFIPVLIEDLTEVVSHTGWGGGGLIKHLKQIIYLLKCRKKFLIYVLISYLQM